MAERITKPGVYDLDDATYHADCCPAPSLSSSIGKVLIDQSPRHAWTAHPRLNPDFEPEGRDTFDLGSAAHGMILGSNVRFRVVDAADWRTKDAKEIRDAARAAGEIPILAHQHARVAEMARAAHAQLALHRDAAGAFSNGVPEQALIWQEGDIWCRAKLDWLPNAGDVFYDLKSTGQNANPDAFERTLFNMAYDFQAAFYRRGIRKVLGIDAPRFRFVVVENAPPYGLSVIELANAATELADRRVQRAIDMWAWCLKENRWPGYPAETVVVDVPVYMETRQLEREDRDQMVRETRGMDAREFMNLYHQPLKGAAE